MAELSTRPLFRSTLTHLGVMDHHTPVCRKCLSAGRGLSVSAFETDQEENRAPTKGVPLPFSVRDASGKQGEEPQSSAVPASRRAGIWVGVASTAFEKEKDRTPPAVRETETSVRASPGRRGARERGWVGEGLQATGARLPLLACLSGIQRRQSCCPAPCSTRPVREGREEPRGAVLAGAHGEPGGTGAHAPLSRHCFHLASPRRRCCHPCLARCQRRRPRGGVA